MMQSAWAGSSCSVTFSPHGCSVGLRSLFVRGSVSFGGCSSACLCLRGGGQPAEIWTSPEVEEVNQTFVKQKNIRFLFTSTANSSCRLQNKDSVSAYLQHVSSMIHLSVNVDVYGCIFDSMLIAAAYASCISVGRMREGL